MVTFPAAERHRPVSGTKLYCFVITLRHQATRGIGRARDSYVTYIRMYRDTQMTQLGLLALSDNNSTSTARATDLITAMPPTNKRRNALH